MGTKIDWKEVDYRPFWVEPKFFESFGFTCHINKEGLLVYSKLGVFIQIWTNYDLENKIVHLKIYKQTKLLGGSIQENTIYYGICNSSVFINSLLDIILYEQNNPS